MRAPALTSPAKSKRRNYGPEDLQDASGETTRSFSPLRPGSGAPPRSKHTEVNASTVYERQTNIRTCLHLLSFDRTGSIECRCAAASCPAPCLKMIWDLGKKHRDANPARSRGFPLVKIKQRTSCGSDETNARTPAASTPPFGNVSHERNVTGLGLDLENVPKRTYNIPNKCLQGALKRNVNMA